MKHEYNLIPHGTPPNASANRFYGTKPEAYLRKVPTE